MSDAIHERMEWDAENGLTIVRTQDVEPVLDYAQELNSAGLGKTPDGWYVATIPLILIEKLQNELGVNILRPEGRDLLFKVLNDADYRKLRIAGGRV
jgi:hypothetical protein